MSVGLRRYLLPLTMTVRRQPLRDSQDFDEVDMLFDLQLEEQQLRVAARRVAANRKLDEVEYWRKRAGWYDDDESMSEYNNGIYNSYYSIDDDNNLSEASSESLSGEGGGINFNTDIIKTVGQVAGALLGVVLLFMLVRAISRGSARRKKGGDSGEKPRKRSGSRRRSTSRSRSKSRPRSRSKRSGNGGTGDDNYELMEEGKKESSRPRSRSKARSRSKSRSRPSSSRREELV